ncbi:MAG: M6 family metalloprotease domain-containing protein [Bacteroidales bacterium]|nr:M6 family metalloprotease domain-containing protein [Bacteroidales bacterium]
MKRLFFAVMLCVCTLTMWAVPAKRITLKVNQPDGTVLTVTLHGDEHFHYFTTEDGIIVKKDNGGFYYATTSPERRLVATTNLAHNANERSTEETAFIQTLPQLGEVVSESRARSIRMRSNTPQREMSVPLRGRVKVPVILLQYKDVKFAQSNPKASFQELLNSNEYYTQERGYGSAQQYFRDQSEDQFIPEFDILGPVTLSQNMKFYGENDIENDDSDKRPREMVEEACQLLNNRVNFSQYDNDGDGAVDFIYIIYAGYGEASGGGENTIWPHQWYTKEPLLMDGVWLYKYACSNELYGYQGKTLAGIGTICHEFSHCLGLPDFYDTEYNGGFGMSSWGVMAGGNHNDDGYTPCGMSGYEKDFLGWKSLIELTEPANITMEAMTEGGNSYKIVNDANPNEYYVVENRQQSKWDAGLPASGMLVIHVDYKQSAWENNQVNTDINHQRMTIIPADNDASSYTLKGDTYPGTSGNTELTSKSTPAARVYSGKFMSKDIVGIAERDGVVSFSFMKDPLRAPYLKEATNMQADGFTLHWNPVVDADGYYVEVKKKAPFLVEEDFTKVTASDGDISSTLDNHTSKKGWTGYNIKGLDEAIRVGTTSEMGVLRSHSFNCTADNFTIYVTLRKSALKDKEPYILLGIGDVSWGNSLRVYSFTLSTALLESYGMGEDGWATIPFEFSKERDNYGTSTFFYMDTRDENNSDNGEGYRVDIDDIHILSGDYASTVSRARIPAKSHLLRPGECHFMIKTEIQTTSLPESIKLLPEDISVTRTFDTEQFKVLTFSGETTDTCLQCRGLEEGDYSCTVRSMKDGAISGYSNTLEVTLKSWFEANGAYYRIVSTGNSEEAEVKVMASPTGNTRDDYNGRFSLMDTVAYNGGIYHIVGIADGAFKNATSLRMIDVHRDGLEIGKNIFYGCTSLNAILWDTDAVLPTNAFDNNTSNLLLYMRDDATFESTHVRNGKIAVIRNGKSGLLTLNRERPFYCPQEFIAEKVVYSRTFSQQTYMGEAAGWEAIALPFDVEEISHNTRGELIPFGESTGKGDFWLAQTSANGFTTATSIQANKPYIISFPNNYSCYGNNSLNGTISFSADNATIHQTIYEATEGEEYLFFPNYDLLGRYLNVFVLNVGDIYKDKDGAENKPGSVFVPATYYAEPFTAYIMPNEKQEAPAMYRIGKQQAKDKGNIAYDYTIETNNGILRIILPEARSITVYDIAGRIICTLQCSEGLNEYSHLPEGFYLIEQTKICITR